MYAYLKGILVESGPLFVVVDVGGIGYKVFIAASALSKLPALQKPVFLYVSHVIRELEQKLFGFVEKEERELFEELIGVTGIGPKIAMSVIGHMSPDKFYQTIALQDTAFLSRIPGIGKKSSERLVMELKDTLSKKKKFSIEKFSIPANQNDLATDALSALVNLGYTQAVAEKAVKKSFEKLNGDADLSLIIAEALRGV